MKTNTKQMTWIKVDGYTRFCLTAIVVLLTVVIIGLWSDVVQVSPEARAAEQFGNNSDYLKGILAEQKTTNEKLDAMTQLLKSGTVEVKVIETEKSSDKASGNGGNNAGK